MSLGTLGYGTNTGAGIVLLGVIFAIFSGIPLLSDWQILLYLFGVFSFGFGMGFIVLAGIRSGSK